MGTGPHRPRCRCRSIIFLVIAPIAYIVLRYTRYGRQVYAVGGNREAARLAGVNVQRSLLSVYVIIGFLAGLAGFVLSARLNSAEAVAGMGYELTVIAAVVIGGTCLFGGVGTIFGTVIGSILIGVLINGLVLMNVNLLRPADHHRRDHRAGRRLRPIRQIPKAGVSRHSMSSEPRRAGRRCGAIGAIALLAGLAACASTGAGPPQARAEGDIGFACVSRLHEEREPAGPLPSRLISLLTPEGQARLRQLRPLRVLPLARGQLRYSDHPGVLRCRKQRDGAQCERGRKAVERALRALSLLHPVQHLQRTGRAAGSTSTGSPTRV